MTSFWRGLDPAWTTSGAAIIFPSKQPERVAQNIRTSQRYVHQLADDEPRSEAREQLDQLLEQASPEQVDEILRATVAMLAPEGA